ncbi:CcdB family protein [Amaricoccus sp.]|uniref:CcdB family protein n=1 Tax=Amaricoccus sp. TaxID=1872485 RepID=UPI001B570926|nr:CcdB family protein [Amaricoccus sp.]MBP7002532.1 CcdB family protein [Amaricoccus sp.]
MAQYDVYRLADGRLVVDMQASSLAALPTRMAAPLTPTDQGPTPLSHLEPICVVDGVACALRVGEMAAIPRSFFSGAPVATLAGDAYRITKAIDFLFTGF